MKPNILLLLAAGLLSCAPVQGSSDEREPTKERPAEWESLATATFAGGCFWCMEAPFEKLEGVHAVVSGYTGGQTKDPTYKQVCAGGTGHAEAVEIKYDPEVIDYDELLYVFWRQIDPTDPGGQFADRGDSYRTEIFYHDGEQRAVAEKSKADLSRSGRFDEPIATRISEAGPFYRAEEYHQDYYKKNAGHYQSYRRGSGRDRYLDQTWGKDRGLPAKTADWKSFQTPSEEELRERLTPLQFQVTQENGTERPFKNEFWNNKQAGIYVDVVSGEPLFSSTHKFDSGTGWPSFIQPLVSEHVTRHEDHKLGYVRTEVRSAIADSHLGHVFKDGPKPTGLRYCINSSALRFIPKDDLRSAGYAEFAGLFE